jgi:hypothetical protein
MGQTGVRVGRVARIVEFLQRDAHALQFMKKASTALSIRSAQRRMGHEAERNGMGALRKAAPGLPDQKSQIDEIAAAMQLRRDPKRGVEPLDRAQPVELKWFCKTGQPAEMYPTMTTVYKSDEETQFFRQVQVSGSV